MSCDSERNWQTVGCCAPLGCSHLQKSPSESPSWAGPLPPAVGVWLPTSHNCPLLRAALTDKSHRHQACLEPWWGAGGGGPSPRDWQTRGASAQHHCREGHSAHTPGLSEEPGGRQSPDPVSLCGSFSNPAAASLSMRSPDSSPGDKPRGPKSSSQVTGGPGPASGCPSGPTHEGHGTACPLLP